MFRVDFFERWVSRVRPWHVVTFWGPLAGLLLARALGDPALGIGTAFLLVAAGVLAWTLLEYLLHRFMFHFRPDSHSELQRDFIYMLHGVHHDYPYDPDRLVMPPLATAVLAALLGFPLHALLGPHRFPAASAGLLAGYLWYDLTHYAVHHANLRGPIGKRLRAYHLAHHFKTPDSGFGVTTPLWDLVFGTYPRKEPARQCSA